MKILWETLREFRQVNESDVKSCRRGEKHGVLHYFIVKAKKKGKKAPAAPERFFYVQVDE